MVAVLLNSVEKIKTRWAYFFCLSKHSLHILAPLSDLGLEVPHFLQVTVGSGFLAQPLAGPPSGLSSAFPNSLPKIPGLAAGAGRAAFMTGPADRVTPAALGEASPGIEGLAPGSLAAGAAGLGSLALAAARSAAPNLGLGAAAGGAGDVATLPESVMPKSPFLIPAAFLSAAASASETDSGLGSGPVGGFVRPCLELGLM